MLPARPRLPALSLLLLCIAALVGVTTATASSPSFDETLLLRPMHDGKLLMHWQFEVSEHICAELHGESDKRLGADICSLMLLRCVCQLSESGMGGRHFTLFPKSLGQVLSEFGVRAMSLSLSSGRWLVESYGYETHPEKQEAWAIVNATSNTAASSAQQQQRMTRIPMTLHAPHGAELWAVLDDEVATAGSNATCTLGASSSSSQQADEPVVRGSVDERWTKLQAALSGLFCASLDQMGSSTSSSPERLVRPGMMVSGAEEGQFRHATLAREGVCTENLAPFLRMLPCRDRRGLGGLLDPLKIFRAHFHSIQIRVEPILSSDLDHTTVIGWTLTQSISALVDPALLLRVPGAAMASRSPDWSLAKLLGSSPGTGGQVRDKHTTACGCDRSSKASVHVHFNPAFAARFPASMAQLLGVDSTATAANQPRFEIDALASSSPLVRHARGHTMLSYDLKRLNPQGDASAPRWDVCPRGGLNFAMRFAAASATQPNVFHARDLDELLQVASSSSSSAAAAAAALSPLDRPIRVQRYLSSSTLHDGTLYILLENPSSSSEGFVVQVFDALPFFLRLAYSTLSVTDGSGAALPPGTILDHSYVPAVQRGIGRDGSSPAQLYFHLYLAPGSDMRISVHFTKEMLTTTEYPPDVSRGFDIGSAIVTVRPVASASAAAVASEEDGEEGVDSVLFYTDGLLLLLPFPDFSMPFNVIAFTSTVLAFFFGSVFNMTYASYADVLKRKPDSDRVKPPPPAATKQTFGDKIKARFCGGKKKTKEEAPSEAAVEQEESKEQ